MLFDVIVVATKNLPATQATLASIEAAAANEVTPVDMALTLVLPHDAAQVTNLPKGFAQVAALTCAKKSYAQLAGLGAGNGRSPWLIFVTAGAELDSGFFAAVQAGIAHHPQAGGFSCRRLPFDTPQHLNPSTLATAHLAGAAFCIQRQAFEKAGGFEKHLTPSYAALELSWRILAKGYTLYALPSALVRDLGSYSQDIGLPAGTLADYLAKTSAAYLLGCKYGVDTTGSGGSKAYRQHLRQPQHFAGVRKALLRQWGKDFLPALPLLFWRRRHPEVVQQTTAFAMASGVSRGYTRLPNPIKAGPLFSVVIRTHRREGSLREALHSLANQTYRNFEVVVVEDGKPTSKQMIEAEFSHLPIHYHATGTHMGRSKAGNLGFSLARGEYLNLLDDDDCFYPDHLELMASQALQHPEADIIFCNSMALIAHEEQANPYRFVLKGLKSIQIGRLDIFTMCQSCQIHIAGAAFKRSLYQRCGGLDENLAAHEDWAMWLRFLAVAQRANPRQIDIERCTTIFTQTDDPELAKKRMASYMESDPAFFNDASILFRVNLADLRYFYDGFIGDMQHVEQLGEATQYLEKQAKRELERE